ncbi:replicative DNA helicase [uncultured Microbulbifer sp.]|uniref:replicative DNA helicase n=1 Tax=uncultured Microbulbifer sp. TaxID=348147 RepID=UPI0025E22E8F|nr:replicative DNA helicase [uncultured Microbulbifer sp.]
MNEYAVPEDDIEEAASSSPLPHSVEAEQSVLGGLMLDASRLDAVSEQLSESDFFVASHRTIFAVMQALSNGEQPLDIVTLAEGLASRDLLADIGGPAYLAENPPSAANIVAYAKIVRERSMLRQLIAAAGEISRTSFNPGGLGSEDLLQMAERRVAEIAEGRAKEGGFVGVDALLKKTVERIDELFKSEGDLTGLSTGLEELDQRTSGWQPGEMIILAARPSMGKTALALNFVEAAMLSQEKPTLVFSMEMPSDSLVMRMLSSIGRIDQGRIRNGKLQEEDWPKLSSAVQKMKGKGLYIDDTPGLSPSEVRARVKRTVRDHTNKLMQADPRLTREEAERRAMPALVMVDYLQLMQVKGSTEGRTQEISEISRSLKALAKEYECPVIALSQLNRGVEQRPNKRPMNSDLRESGAIEQDADVILFIYRDEYYNEDSPDKGLAELIIGKQRNGEIGTCRAAFVGKYTRFDNLAPEYYQGAE